jgi:hypothetical protein
MNKDEFLLALRKEAEGFNKIVALMIIGSILLTKKCRKS